MIRYLRFYISPVTNFLIACLLFLGGAWMWLPAILQISATALADQIFELDTEEKDYRHPFLLDLALYLSTPAALFLFFAIFWVAGSGNQDPLGFGLWIHSWLGIDLIAIRNHNAWYHYALMLFSLAIPITGVGGLAGHELIHRTWRPFDLWLGRFTMALNWGIAFPIEHVYGHHAYVGTTKDPATAARGDSLYTHLPKAMYRTIANAWEIESNRLRKLEKPLWSFKNNLLRLATIATTTTLVAYWMAGWRGVLFHLTLCFMAKVVLEALNYVEHYGIVRLPDRPVQPRHSWNCNHLVSGIFTYNLTRHSHHHADAQVPFQNLRAYHDQPEMPGGFMTAYLTVFVPSLWRRRIAPKLKEWDENYASPQERVLAKQANENSGWPELLRLDVAAEGAA